MRRFTVMGFTEAELGFVLAAVFAAVGVSTLQDYPVAAVDKGKYDEAVRQRDSIAGAFDRFRDSTADALDRFRDSAAVALNRLRDSVRSTKTPQCWEKGEPRAPIAELRVVARDRYELKGERLSFREIRSRFAPQIARAEALKCRYLVRAHLTSGVDAVAQASAVWRLRAHFDVDDRPR